MKRILIIISSLSVWVLIILYFVFASNLSERRQRGDVIERVNVVVKDSAIQRVITPSMVLGWFSSEKFQLVNVETSKLNTMEVAKFIMQHKFVRNVSVYVDMMGNLSIDIEQRRPIARFNTANGYSFYVTSDNYILPLQSHEVIYVPIITGDFTPPFNSKFVGDWTAENEGVEKKMSKNYNFFKKLINFVNVTREDLFLSSHIVQMNILGRGSISGTFPLEESEIELVPRVGNHIIRLGELSDVERKLRKLMSFYKHSANSDIWSTQTYINLEYDGQVVCTKM